MGRDAEGDGVWGEVMGQGEVYVLRMLYCEVKIPCDEFMCGIYIQGISR